MKKSAYLTLIMCCAMSACVTDDLKSGGEPVALSESAVESFAAGYKDPRNYWLSIQPDRAGYHMKEAFRVHPKQRAVMDIGEFGNSLMPVFKTRNFENRYTTTLLDIASAESFYDVKTARKLGGIVLGYDRALPYRGIRDLGGIPAILTLQKKVKLAQLHVERATIFALMQSGGMGNVDRGAGSNVRMVLGYDFVSSFEYVQFNFASGNVIFSATDKFEPNKDLIAGEAMIVPGPYGGCTVIGSFSGGKDRRFLLDPCGQFAFAEPGLIAPRKESLAFIGELAVPDVETVPFEESDKGELRVGIEVLKKYNVTICPQAGKVYFEKPVIRR